MTQSLSRPSHSVILLQSYDSLQYLFGHSTEDGSYTTRNGLEGDFQKTARLLYPQFGSLTNQKAFNYHKSNQPN